MSFPICVICFYAREDGSLPTSMKCWTIEEAYSLVCMRQHEIQCVMLQGDVLHRNMTFPNYEAYQKRKNTFTDKLARAIFHRIVGPYSPRMRSEYEKEQEEE